MNDRNLARGLFLVAISLFFGLQALRYPTGTLSHTGPGLFPLIVSGLLMLIGAITVVRSRLEAGVPLAIQPRNIAIILTSLCGFALISTYFHMIAGIVFMVFFSSLAASTFSVARSLKVAAGLIAVAFAFQKLLGLNLPLY